MVTIRGDILDVRSGVIAHQVNCRGKFGRGLARQIERRHPEAYRAYMAKFQREGWRLGDAQFVEVLPGLEVANLAGQDRYGLGRCFTDYGALALAIRKAAWRARERGVALFLPHGIGCGLAGGDWDIVSSIIRTEAPDARIVQL